MNEYNKREDVKDIIWKCEKCGNWNSYLWKFCPICAEVEYEKQTNDYWDTLKSVYSGAKTR